MGGPSPASITTQRPGQSHITLPILQRDGEKVPSESGTLPRKSLAQRQKTFDPEQVLPIIECDHPLTPAHNPRETTFWDYFPFLRPILCPGQSGKTESSSLDAESNIPLEITLYLNSYLIWLITNSLLPSTIVGAMVNNIQMLQDAMSNLTRIRNTPLPSAYQAHLRISLW